MRRLGDDGNAVLHAGVSADIGLQIGGEGAQRSRDDISDEIFRRLTIECRISESRIRNHDIAGHILEWLLQTLKRGGLRLESLRLEALQKRHQIAEQPDELLDV